MATGSDGARRAARRPGTSATRRTPVDTARGALVLIGGACSPGGDALGTFIRLAGAVNGASIIGLTTASNNSVRAAAAWRKDFASAGVANVDIPIVDSRDR